VWKEKQYCGESFEMDARCAILHSPLASFEFESLFDLYRKGEHRSQLSGWFLLISEDFRFTFFLPVLARRGGANAGPSSMREPGPTIDTESQELRCEKEGNMIRSCCLWQDLSAFLSTVQGTLTHSQAHQDYSKLYNRP
jgi:hypothetical protein